MKNISGKCMIFYTFQSKNNKDYNITTFKKSSPAEPKIRDVLHQLPLDFVNNSYHFRFRSEFFEADEKIVGWIDISNLLAKVPIIQNNIFVKILTLPADKDNKLFNKDKLKAIGLLDPKGQSLSQQSQQSSHSPQPINQTPVKQAHPIATNPPHRTPQSPKSDIFDIHAPTTSDTKPSKSPAPVPKSPSPISKSAGPASKSPAPSDKKPVFVAGGETSEQMHKAYLQQLKKQEEEREMEKKAIKIHEEKLNEWGYSGHKTINNLTTLLATLHQIWPEWKAVSLSDMLRPEDVTSIYKRAVVKLHPDKNQDKDYLTKYLSKRIFELLNEAKKAQK